MNFLRRKWNSTIRMRLTVLYAVSFFLAGLVLIGLMYFQLNEVIGRQLIFRVDNLADNGPVPTTTFLQPPPLEGSEDEPADAQTAAPDGTSLSPGPPDM